MMYDIFHNIYYTTCRYTKTQLCKHLAPQPQALLDIAAFPCVRYSAA
jgi:hypothetical protein